MTAFQDLTGHRFGRLVVLKRMPDMTYPGGHHQSAWLCRCDCGTERTFHGRSVKRGATKSCGCLRREIIVRIKTKHGHSTSSVRSREYRSWDMMKQRCLNPRNKRYPAYGGRGIQVCDRWQKSFIAFFEDMGSCPPGLTIDRIDNDGDYEPSNCRWATKFQQMNNQRKSRRLTFQGRTQTITQWARELGFKRGTVEARIKRGWPIKRALSVST